MKTKIIAGIILSLIEINGVDGYKNEEGRILCSNCCFLDAMGKLN